MANYHLYFVSEYKIIGSDRISATDDAEAFRIAGLMGDGRNVEIWNDHSRIGLVATSKAA